MSSPISLTAGRYKSRTYGPGNIPIPRSRTIKPQLLSSITPRRRRRPPAMDIEQKQSDLIDHFVKQAATASGSTLAALLAEATSHPALFAFSEILSVPNLSKLEGTQYSSSLDLLRLFAYGTWRDYKSNAASLPSLLPDQICKLKQLSVLTLSETEKVLPYDQLMQELDVSNVRELEDFLIDCMYVGIVRGKLDQWRRCFEVQFAAGRDLKPKQLSGMIQTLENWLGTSENLLLTIQEKIKWADTVSEDYKKHRKEIEDKAEEVKKSLKKCPTLSRQTWTYEATRRSSILNLEE